jgi:hypothetical protein
MKTTTQIFAEKYLDDIKWPNKYEVINFKWNVSGILKGRSNEHLKFDTRPMNPLEDGRIEKKIGANNQSNKVLCFSENYYYLIDTEEFYSYMKNENKKEVCIDELLKNLSWNIKLPK